ncbi:secondary thiamine-phosphate synthase enzyme YjbQ [Methanohalobium sp.]|uniref:secondary thiamine-phosphate synthase enzyme YjbQ n=1 Tax=Methanohalobium sp. TaxID=2837493 RepID=UPI0025F38FAD|nr:secondary thiamine-phosphate synthase enzyme YjbQ [Methanohalobium sp.]
MSVLTRRLKYETEANIDIVNITSDVSNVIDNSGIKNGFVTVFVPGSTAAVTSMEYEPGLTSDLTSVLEKIAPSDVEYQHDNKWHDGNGFSHVRASLLGQSETFPIINSELANGPWQQIVLINLDNRPRYRELILQIYGE